MYQNGGSFLISTFTKNETVKEVVEVILTEIKNIEKLVKHPKKLQKPKII